MLRSFVHFCNGLWAELRGAVAHTQDIRSRGRLVTDILLFRVIRLVPRLGAGARMRTVMLDGASITYRLNRGDIQGIREVWFDETYRVPGGPPPRTVLDLGANIGLTSVWLARRYECTRVVAVEPDPDNAVLALRNLRANGIPGEVIACAVGPRNETASFSKSVSSNVGSLVSRQHEDQSIEVEVRTPADLLVQGGLAAVDLCKMDIEGGEEPLLLEGNPGWLDGVRTMLAEIHGEVIDGDAVIEALGAAGLAYVAPEPGAKHGTWFVRAR